ncbi:MAG TPA: cobalamin-dependent protein, partial [Candidatus Goldiibacteriota bacterium]|nr:cobalamin-dependent protein [Candidatus Goldiibacteriota bacterium]
MADILFFNQYFSAKQEQPEYILTQYRLPLNLLYVATYARSKGLDCKVIELGVSDYKDYIIDDKGKFRYGLSDEKITEIILREKPKIIGIGCVFTQHFWDIPVIAKLVKGINPDIKVVVGGNHATVFANDILREPAIDYVVRGEGEITFYELAVHVLRGEKNISEIKGIAYRDAAGEIRLNEPRPLIKDIEELPLPDYSLIEVERYIMPKAALSPYVMRYPLAGIFTSRGCPENCIYCTVKSVWGRSWRGISAKKTVDWIEMLVKKYGVREISFLDD